MPMDLQEFYRQARALQHEDEEAARMAADQRQKAIEAEWKKLAGVIREALPIEGLRLFEKFEGQFNELPNPCYGHQLYAYILPSGDKEEVRFNVCDPYMLGFIRVLVYWNDQNPSPHWEVTEYEVVVDSRWVRFTKPYAAVIAAVDELKKHGVLTLPDFSRSEISDQNPHPLL